MILEDVEVWWEYCGSLMYLNSLTFTICILLLSPSEKKMKKLLHFLSSALPTCKPVFAIQSFPKMFLLAHSKYSLEIAKMI